MSVEEDDETLVIELVGSGEPVGWRLFAELNMPFAEVSVSFSACSSSASSSSEEDMSAMVDSDSKLG